MNRREKKLLTDNRRDELQNEYNIVFQKVMNYRISKIILVANYYDIFTLIHQGCQCVHKICEELETNPRATELLLNALVSINVLEKDENIYSNTNISREFLVKGKPNYKGDNLKYQELIWDCWTKLKDVIKTGLPPIGLEELLSKQDTDFVRDYIYGMDNIAKTPAMAIAKNINLARVRKMLDVGGGAGTYSIYFAKVNPCLEADILDLPLTANITREIVSKSNVSDRVRIIQGDYISYDFGAGYDLAFISHVMHNEGEDVNQFLVNKSYKALNPRGILAIHDFLIDDCKTSPAFPAIFSINMLVYTKQGRTYSWEEYKSWMQKAGFSDLRQVDILQHLENRSSLLLGEKPM